MVKLVMASTMGLDPTFPHQSCNDFARIGLIAHDVIWARQSEKSRSSAHYNVQRNCLTPFPAVLAGLE